MRMSTIYKVASVVVTYYPDPVSLALLIRELSKQCMLVVVVNNSPATVQDSFPVSLNGSRLVFVNNKKNLGIGAAQNIGISVALKEGVSHVAIFDQDSLPDSSMVERLVAADILLRSAGVKVAAVGPRLVDQSTGGVGAFISFFGYRKQRLRPPPGSPPVPCFSLLASGTLFSCESLASVGLMDPDLFLEYVDVEWGARARSKGYTCYGVPAATLFHNLGDSRIRLPGGLNVPFHRPVRHFYTIRNAIFMQKQDYVPFYWKINDIFRTLAGFFIYACFNPPRFKQITMMLFGAFQGVKGVLGPFSIEDLDAPGFVKRILKWASA